MVVVGGPRAEQTQDFGICRNFGVLHIFGEVFVDLVPKVAQILPKVAPNPWDLALDLWGSPYRAHRAHKGPIRALIGLY